VRIETGKADRVTAVLVGHPDGRIERVPTPLLVLAAGAVETPRLLLASDNLGNDSGMVGRNFMETITVMVGALHPEPQHGRRGLPSDAICWDFNAPDAIPGVPGGFRLYNASGETGPAGLADYARRVVPGWGARQRADLRRQFGHALCVAAIGESLPNDQTHVSLDPRERGSFGLPLARIAARLEPAETARLVVMAKKCRDMLAASGADDIYESYSSWNAFNASHVFGTCRMGTNPAGSVVDADGRSHRWRNLLIADASVFPSSGGGEAPSLTIQALALRLADRVGR
jgi:choline dehydrogenase-like flavoprotein